MGITQVDMLTGLNKVETATALIKAFEPPEGFYLAFSGGKDSVVIHNLTVKATVKFDAHYCVSPIDPREIHQFIKEYYPSVAWDYHARGFWKLVVKKGLPRRNARWCCKVIKEAGGDGRVVILGNRRAEGANRSKQKCFEKSYNGKKMFLRPIIDWTDGEVWEYIRERNLDYCSLYDEGFHRLGCVLCPFARNVKREIERFPKIAGLWRLSADHIIQRRQATGKTYKREFADGQELWDWWVSRK